MMKITINGGRDKYTKDELLNIMTRVATSNSPWPDSPPEEQTWRFCTDCQMNHPPVMAYNDKSPCMFVFSIIKSATKVLTEEFVPSYNVPNMALFAKDVPNLSFDVEYSETEHGTPPHREWFEEGRLISYQNSYKVLVWDVTTI